MKVYLYCSFLVVQSIAFEVVFDLSVRSESVKEGIRFCQ